MISSDMRIYTYSTLGGNDAYGQPQIAPSVGEIKMAINIISQTIGDNIKYKDATYIGLTQAYVDDTYIIDYENEKLKVLYVNPKGRYKQVFMALK